MSLEETFGVVLKEVRLKKGLSQEALAYNAGLHTATISFYERGKKSPTLFSIFAMAKALDIYPSDLMKALEEAHSPESE